MKKILVGFIALTLSCAAFAQNEFITVWDNSKTAPLAYPSHPANDTIIFPGIGTNYTIYWEDVNNMATNGTITGNGYTLIPFPAQGTYRVKTSAGTGTFTGFSMAYNGSANDVLLHQSVYNNTPAELVQVAQWGNTQWTSLSSAFYGAINMDVTATDAPNLTNVTDLSNMFHSCYSLVGNTTFNSWNVANITNINAMFYAAQSFNQNIASWNVSNVTDMGNMFAFAIAFNQSIGSWNVGNVTNMNGTFVNALIFNQPLNWNTSKVTDMGSTFAQDPVFNQPSVSGWDVSNVTVMNNMFAQAVAFNQPLNNWNVGNVTDMSGMFSSANTFNQPLNSWNVGNVTDASGMFTSAIAFNQPLNSWNVANVTNMNGMFANATAFNQPLNSWNLSKVSITDIMFYGATTFNQNLGNWSLNSLTSAASMFANSGLTCVNYDAALVGWANNTITRGSIDFSGETGMVYSSAAAVTARNTLISSKSWTIDGDTYDSTCEVIALPVTLVSFEASKQNNTTLLTWHTATETNNKGFAVQRSIDGKNWSDIGFVGSKAQNGNSSMPLNYAFTDNSPVNGINYYRLAQQDIDGKIAYSAMASVTFAISTMIYPNPATSVVNVVISNPATYTLINVLGVTVQAGNLNSGKNMLNISSLAAGTYFLRINSNNVTVNNKIEIKK